MTAAHLWTYRLCRTNILVECRLRPWVGAHVAASISAARMRYARAYDIALGCALMISACHHTDGGAARLLLLMTIALVQCAHIFSVQ